MLHSLPPCEALTASKRERAWKPPPHETEQSPHCIHGPGTQSVGHRYLLHDRVCVAAPHGTPPYAMERATVRLRACSPVPHDLLHWLQLPHSFCTQSTAHECVLHVLFATSALHTLPPNATLMSMERWRDCVPDPQLRVHWVHEPQSDSLQSIGHSCVLQACSARKLGQAFPP